MRAATRTSRRCRGVTGSVRRGGQPQPAQRGLLEAEAELRRRHLFLEVRGRAGEVAPARPSQPLLVLEIATGFAQLPRVPAPSVVEERPQEGVGVAGGLLRVRPLHDHLEPPRPLAEVGQERLEGRVHDLHVLELHSGRRGDAPKSAGGLRDEGRLLREAKPVAGLPRPEYVLDVVVAR